MLSTESVLSNISYSTNPSDLGFPFTQNSSFDHRDSDQRNSGSVNAGFHSGK